MGKSVYAVRAFFSTYYEEDAKALIEKLSKLEGELRSSRSRVVPELYYVEIIVDGPSKLEEVAENTRFLLEEASRGGRVYGIKVYTVPPLEAGSEKASSG